jgi:hypothetical protein
MGFVRKTTGIDLTGGGVRDAAGAAANIQAEYGMKAMEALRGDLAPFRQVGEQSANMLLQSIIGAQPEETNQVLNDPFFRALSNQQSQDLLAQNAALGLGGSGGTRDALNRNMLLLGQQFRSDERNRQLNRFNQLMGITTMGQNAAAQTGSGSANILTDIGAARSTVPIVGANVAAQQGQQLMGLFGAAGAGYIGSSAASAGGGTGALAALLGGMGSDRRLKTNIKRVGNDEHGNIYRFKYIGGNNTYEGRMADELKEIRPDAVKTHPSGYLMVTDEFKARLVCH